MANSPLHSGLGELGQRLQALGDPAVEPPRLRPYQGGSHPAGPAATPSAAHVDRPSAPPSSSFAAWQAPPAPPEPFPGSTPETGQHAAQNGYAHGPVGVTQPASGSATTPPGAAPTQASGTSQEIDAAAQNPLDPSLPSGFQRAINAVRNSIPLVQRLLPLLEGNIATAATAITALVTPQPSVQPIHHAPAAAPVSAPPPVPVAVDLEPIERGLSEVRTSHRELKTQVAEQVTTLKRVEDQLEHVREATDRNTLEQQELVEDLRAVGGRVNTFAIVGLVLLVLSLVLNGFLVFELQRILR